MTDNKAQHHPGRESRFFYGHLIVTLSFLIMVVSIGAHNSFGVFLKPILSEFGWTRAMTSTAFSLSMIVSGLLGVLVGGLNDRFGPRVVLSVCGCFLGLGYVLISQIGALWQLYLVYGLIIGIGMAGAWVPIVSTVARWFAKRRGIMTGLVVAGQGIGTLIAPPMANLLISTYGWRMSFIVLGSVVLIVVVLAVQFLRREPSQNRPTAYGHYENEVNYLKSTPESLTFNESLRTTQFWIFAFMLFCFGFSMFSIIIHIAPHATELGISSADAANILGTAGGLSIVGNAILGFASDRAGNKKIFAVSFILMSAVLVWLALATSQWQLYLFACVFGFAYGGLAAIESPLAAELFGLKSHGLIYGIASIGFTVGAAVGPVITGHIFDITDSYKTAFLACAATSAVAFILALTLKPTGIKSSTTAAG